MLVLTRKPNESITIDGEIEITVLEVTGNRIRLGIKAPPAVKILRNELVVIEPTDPSPDSPHKKGDNCGGKEMRRTA